MKRAGKVFLALTLVLAMLWTSTGTSNVPGVLAENVASMQSAKDNKEAVKATTEETTTETKEKSTTASKAEQETTAKKEETTTQEAATEAETKKEEAATREKKAESTTAAKKKTAKSKIATQDAAEAATKGSDSNSSNQNIARAAKIDIAKCITAVDMSVTINGKKTALDDLPAGTLVPRGAPVSIIVKYDNVDHALENLGEGTVLYYQLPEQIEIVADQQGDLTEEGKVVGKFTISKKGLVEITFTEGYLTDCGGKIEQGSFWINGNFNKEFGGKGQETIIFGPVKKTIHFDPKLEEDKTNLNVTKKITGFDAKTQKLTYTITVTAPADNTQTVKDVKVTDVFADNSLKMLENLYKDINASKGTFDAKTGIWTIGDMEKGEIQTLTYSVKIKNSWDDTITDKTISNTATVTAGTEKKAEVTSNKVFNNNLNITKSTVDGTYGTSKGIHVDATGTWIKYTITVNASNVNQDDASGVKVTDVFSDDKEDIEQYYAIEGATQTNSTEPGAGEIYIDNNKKDFIWNIGTMKPGETKTLTYCVKLKDSVWENSGNTSDTVKKKFTNKATLTATGMEEDKSATTTVNLKKKWISKKGEWDAATGKMKFTVQANKGDNNSPVLDRNFTFTDKMTGDYAYTGNLVIEAKNASGKTQWTDIISLDDSDKQTLEHGTFTWNTDGGWTYKAAQAGEFVYYLTYYAKPTANGHNHISNTASIGINGSSYEHKTNWSGTGSEEIALTKEYVSGVTAGKMKWRTTIPVRVVEGSAYVDTISSPKNHKFVSEDKLREGLDIYFGQESNKLKEGKDYTLTYNDDYKFTITFLHEIDADSTNRIVITYYTENTVARDDAKYKDGDKFTYTNAGKLTIREGQELSVSDSTVWYKHSSISKEAGDYDKTNRTIRWFITLNKDGTLGTLDGENSVAAITDTLPEGLKYVTKGNTQNIQITERGKQAAKAAIDSNSIVYGSRSFSILKVDSQTQALIEGAKFKLEKAKVENGEITGFETVMNEGKETQTTGENEKIKFIGLKKDGLYRFTEVSAAPGYKNSGKTIYVAFTKAMQDFGAKAGYTVTGIAGGATIQVENMPAGSLTIEKKVIGNNIPEETYEMSVTAAEGNTDTDLTKAAVTDTTDNNAAITPAISTKDGQSTLTFSLKAGHKAKVSGLPVGTYNVTENAASRSETDKTAYTASYSVDGNSVSNVKVKVAQDADSNAVPNVTVTNTYKTELKVLKKDIGTDAPLSGAQLAIYNNSDVTFDSEGKATVKAGATAVASWTSGTDAKDLTGKVVTDGNYVLVETAVPTSDYVQAAAIPFKVDAEGQIQVADAYANNYNDSTHTITLNNQKKTGSLTVKKIIEDGEADTAFDFTVTFTNFNNGKGGDVTVTRKGKEGKDQPETKTVKPDADGSLKLELKALTNNEAVKISGIPYGTSYTVTETQQEGYLETANSNLTGIIGDNGTAANGVERATDAEASITNTRLTGFTVKKLAEYGQYTPDAETKDNKQFKFKVTLTRNDAVYTRKFTIKYSDKEQSEEVRATNGVYEFTLKDTQSAAFSDLPSGTKYTVEEVADSDYDASVKVNNTVQNADSNNNADNNKNVAATAEGTIDKTGDTVEFTNARKLGAFSFTKTVKGNMQDKEQSYDFYVEVDGKPFNGNAAITQKDTEKSDDADTQDKTKEDKSENTAGTTVQITDGKLSLTDGQTATIANIPAGVSYSIKETTGDRYVTLINDKITAETTGTVEEGKTTETQFVNQVIHLNITKTDLTGEREVTGAAMTLYKAEDVNEDGTVKDGAEALDSWVSGKESFHDFGPAIKAGESYVLVETVAPDGYTYAENISFTVNADGTIKTDAEKTTDKETGEDVYLVKDDVTKVSIKKMDIIGNNEVAGARLLLKDKEGNVIESWMSATEAHVFEQKLIAGETYTLAEVTAPSGYEVAADITFTVNKDGTVSIDGKAVDGNEIIMKDDTTPVGEEGKLVVSKLVTFQGKNQAVNRTFYVALFSDADCTQKVSNVKELKCEGAWSAYTVFEHLKDGTYYVAETDEDGNKLESSEACKIEGNGTKCQITPTQKTAYAVIENQLLIPGDDFLNTLHNLTVTKNVTLDGEQISEKYSGTFYVSLFTDPYYTNRTGDVKELQIQNGKSTSVSFTDLADGTYYVAETDKDGNPVENTDFGFDVSYDGDITVSFTEQNTDSTLAITNDMTEKNPEYDKYLKEDDGDDGKEKKKTSTSKNNSSNKTTKKGKNSKTGDNSHILFYAALAAAALAAGSAEVYRRRRRATGRNKHDR